MLEKKIKPYQWGAAKQKEYDMFFLIPLFFLPASLFFSPLAVIAAMHGGKISFEIEI